MPKLNFIDTGLACHLLGLRDADQVLASQYYGGLLKNLIFMELCKQDFKALGKLAEYAGSRLIQGILFYTGKDILPFRVGDRAFHAVPVGLFI